MNMPIELKFKSIKPPLAAIMQLLMLLTVLVLVSACASNQTEDPDEKSQNRKSAESNTSLGLEYMNRGQYELALGKLKKAVKADPGYAPAQTVLAVLYDEHEYCPKCDEELLQKES